MRGRLMTQKKPAPFDPGTYLVKVRGGEAVKEYRKKQTIFLQGSPADAVFYIEKGKVKLTVLSARGKEAVVAILGSGDFFGEGSLAGQPLRMRSEEHTSELQSHSDLVCRLLLEKKKQYETPSENRERGSKCLWHNSVRPAQ